MKSDATFVIPVFNGEKYLAEAIQSCIDQTTLPDAIIVVDDASTDRTPDIIRWFAQKYPETVLPVFRKHNGGRSLARNSGVECIQTKYCLFLDADDVAERTRVERQVEFMEKNPDVFASSSFVSYIDETGRVISKGTLDVLTRKEYSARMRTGEVIGFFSSATIVRTSVFQNEHLFFREVFRQAQDVDLWNRISERHVILAQPEFLARYRIHGDSVTTRKYYRSRLFYEYVRDCMRRRRHGELERSWDDFQEAWQKRPWRERFSTWRKTRAKKLFHDAGFALARRRYGLFVFNWFMSLVFQPTYTVRRTISRLRK